MPDLDDELITAVKAGDLAGVQAVLAAGAGVRSRNPFTQPLSVAAASGHLAIVQCLIDAGADVHLDNDLALQWAAMIGYADVVSLLRTHGAHLKPIIANLHRLPPAVQVAAFATGKLGRLSVEKYARHGICPEALCVLMARKGHTALAAMVRATRMLDRLPPEDRAAMLDGFLHTGAKPESPYV